MSENQAEEQDEPTMEEILASIRRIISEDSDEGEGKPADDGEDVEMDEAEAAADAESQPEPEPEPEPEEAAEPDPEPEPEEEAEVAAEAEAEPEPEPEPEIDAAGDEGNVLELTEDMEAASAQEAEPESEQEPVEDKQPAPEAEEPDTLVASVTEEATRQSFDKLSALMVAGYSGSGNTLEGLVRELLKPMIKAYLDENLPRIVEDCVEREVARISRRPGK